jgi:hypothetical protein
VTALQVIGIQSFWNSRRKSDDPKLSAVGFRSRFRILNGLVDESVAARSVLVATVHEVIR